MQMFEKSVSPMGTPQETTTTAGAAAANTTVKMETVSVYEYMSRLVSGNAVVVFAISGCCMCHVVKQLLFGLGVGPAIVELDRDACGRNIHRLLFQQQSLPAVFVGGKFLGGVETVMACHINGSLVPLLKEAGALWL